MGPIFNEKINKNKICGSINRIPSIIHGRWVKNCGYWSYSVYDRYRLSGKKRHKKTKNKKERKRRIVKRSKLGSKRAPNMMAMRLVWVGRPELRTHNRNTILRRPARLAAPKKPGPF